METIQTGCYIDGHWGQYGFGRLLTVAESFGWVNASNVNEDNQNDFDLEFVVDLADEAENWLNENVAPADTSFGWFDGEFFLWTNTDWSEV
jgi:hypothetical protein